MNRFDIKPGRGRKAFAVFLVIAAAASAIQGPLSARFLAAALAVAACDLAFIPSPPFNLRLGEIYAMARQGWRMPWIGKILSAISFVLLVTSCYLKWQGR